MRKALLGLLIVSLLLSLPGLMQRYQAERNNNTYETIVPIHDLESIVSKDSSLQLDEVLKRVQESGLQAVSVLPETLASLEEKGYVTVLTGERIKEMSIFNSGLEKVANQVSTDGVYVYIQKRNEITDRLTEVFSSMDTQPVTISGREFIYLSNEGGRIDHLPVGYLPETIESIKKAGLSVVLRIPNISKEENPYVFNQLLNLSDNITNRVLFTGVEVIGYPETNQIKEYAEKLKEKNIAVYAIEFAEQSGINTMAKTMDMDVIRLHSLDLNKVASPEEGVDRAVRAVKERNIRSLFLRTEEGIEAEKALQNLESFIQNMDQQMPSGFKSGNAKVFDKVTIPAWSYMAAFLAAIIFISLAVLEITKNKLLYYISFAGTLLLGLAALILNNPIFVQGLALITAMAAPVFAIIPRLEIKGFADILKAYGRAALVSSAGILIIVSLLNGNEYLVKIEAFRGVKLIYIVPLLVVFIYILKESLRSSFNGKFIIDLKKLWNMRVLYGHLAIIGILGIIGLYYISRTGNAGSVSSFELAIRQWLEETMYVRPRTKEFLIGFPFYILSLYMYSFNKKLGTYLLIPSVIGYLSIVNTFTHLHIPLFVSLLRTIYSLAIGLGVGFIFIVIFKKGLSIYNEKIKPRWGL
ncbi:hypothetical protein DFO70_108326 [Cytobacillus firmus]|uniref:Uncharacterized protein n=2 Tax=Cytobacillus TaxID=2675230 RepID=A0A366JTZ9_CYTFI|nr:MULTISPECIES: DUF5693 family protein [Cytobacillus]RBP91534.1 hypothetical protein DFO70_108326 [Cytobacillus firmus]TDX41734.1 hypothetical protein DFO72_108326 [Cytobacillus oceanisediminis]